MPTDRALPAAYAFVPVPRVETAMSLDERFRTALTEVMTDVRSRLEAEFAATVADVQATAEREKADALAAAEQATAAAVEDARNRLQVEMQEAFETEKSALASTHEQQIAQAADAARLEATRVGETAAAEAERLRAEAEQAAAHARTEAEATVEAIRQELRASQDAALRLREEHDGEVARLRADYDALIASVRDEATQLRDEVARLTQQRDEALSSSGDARAEVEAVTMRLRGEFESLTLQAQQMAEAALASARSEAQTAAALHGQALDAHQMGTVRLLDGIRALDAASSLTEVLDALTQSAAREAGRAAVLVVKGERLVGWRTAGFGSYDHDARVLEGSTGDTGALAAAVNTGRPAMVGAGSVLTAPAFSESPADRPGLAVPLLVAGRTVAVVYADPGVDAAPVGWTSPVEVLVRHAARCLEGLAVHRAAAAARPAARVGAPA